MLSSLLPFDTHLLLTSAVIVVIVQLLFFAFAATFKTDKVTDLSYGLTFALLVVLYHFEPGANNRSFMVFGLIFLWGLRISFFLFSRIMKMGHDERFNDRRDSVFKFAMFWMLQAVAIWTVTLPATFLAANPGNALTVLDYMPMVIAIAGLYIEHNADRQKMAFRQNPANKGKFINTGLWGFVQYPNYLGEIMFWTGITLLCRHQGLALISYISPVFISLLLIKVSGIPLLEKLHTEKYGSQPEWQAYRAKTKKLIPFVW